MYHGYGCSTLLFCEKNKLKSYYICHINVNIFALITGINDNACWP